MAQEVFERIEKKYLLPETVFRRLLPELRKHMADDVYGRYTISNIYFDTEQFGLIRASLEKPVYKEKLRLRCYGTPSEDGKVFVEIKKKYKGIVYKRRITLSLKEARRYLVYGIRPDMTDWKFTRQQIFKEIDYMKERYGLRPAAFIAYDRIALAGTEDPELRVTFDTNIRYRTDHVNLYEDGTEKKLAEGKVMLEVKAMNRYPLWLVRILSKMNLRQTSFSKYGTIYTINFEKSGRTRRIPEHVYTEKENRVCSLQY